MDDRQISFLLDIYRSGCYKTHSNKSNIYHLRRKANPYKQLITGYDVDFNSDIIDSLVDKEYCYKANGNICLTKKGIEYARVFLDVSKL